MSPLRRSRFHTVCATYDPPHKCSKQPYFISAADGAVLSIAGLCDEWRDPETSDTVSRRTLIVTEVNDLTRRIHDRMPVLLGWASSAIEEKSLRAMISFL